MVTREEHFCQSLPLTLGAGERESISIAKHRSSPLLSNESRVAHYCRQYNIPCIRLPDILRSLWLENILTKAEVRNMINELQIEDGMRFKQTTLNAILDD